MLPELLSHGLNNHCTIKLVSKFTNQLFGNDGNASASVCMRMHARLFVCVCVPWQALCWLAGRKICLSMCLVALLFCWKTIFSKDRCS